MSGWELLEAIILGIVQGIAEFLPISSSGHLVICDAIFDSLAGRDLDPEASLRMTIALHVGTLFSILWVYRRDLWELRHRHMVRWCVAIATLPLVGVALIPLNGAKDTLKDLVELVFQTPMVAGVGLLVTSALLLVAQHWESNTETLDDLGPLGAFAIGLYQAVAIVPGISRSGSTIAGGLLLGLRRDAAAAFAFLLAIPAIGGATILLLRESLQTPSRSAAWPSWVVGATVAFVVGLFALRWLIHLVKQGRLHWFAWYCAIVGAATIVWQLAVRE